MPSEAQFVVHQCAQFSADTKLPHNQAVKRILKYLKGTSKQGLLMNPDPKKLYNAMWNLTSLVDEIKMKVIIPDWFFIE